MFNKSLIEILCNVLGAIFLLAFVLHLSMFVWALVGTPPVEIYDVKKGLISYYALISQLASFVFISFWRAPFPPS